MGRRGRTGSKPAAARAAAGGGARRAYAAAIAVAVVLTYANSLPAPFVLDDQATVVQNPQIRDLSRLDEVLAPAADSPIAGRPLASLTFALNYAAGGLDVRGYRLTNLALHLACALLIFLFVRRTLQLPRPRALFGSPDGEGGDAQPAATLAAFGTALVWAVHPLNSETVNYLSQRTESLMAACYLLTLYAALRAASPADGPPAKARGHSRRWAVAAVAACAAGMMSKESMVTAPVMVALYDRVLLFDSWRTAFARRKGLYLALASTWMLAALLIASGPRAAVAGAGSGIPPLTYLLNQAVIITEYLRLAVWPDALVVFYGWPLPLSISDVVPYVAFIGGLGLLTLLALWRWPMAGLAGAWFFITLAPASSVVPIATEVGAERRMYLPLVALVALAIGALIVGWQRIMPRVRRAAGSAVRASASLAGAARQPEGPPLRDRGLALVPVVSLLLVAVVLAALTVRRNAEYASPLTLVQTVVDRRPTGVAHHMLAEQLVQAGRVDDAMPHLRHALALGNSRAGYLLGRALVDLGRHREAIPVLEAFLRTANPPAPLVPAWLEPPPIEVIPARFALGRAYGTEGQWSRAEEQGRLILQAVPAHVGAQGLLGDAAFAQEQWGVAAGHYRVYLQRQPGDLQALLNYGVALVATGRLDDAIAAFTRAAALEPGSARARELLALAREDRARLGPR